MVYSETSNYISFDTCQSINGVGLMQINISFILSSVNGTSCFVILVMDYHTNKIRHKNSKISLSLWSRNFSRVCLQPYLYLSIPSIYIFIGFYQMNWLLIISVAFFISLFTFSRLYLIFVFLYLHRLLLILLRVLYRFSMQFSFVFDSTISRKRIFSVLYSVLVSDFQKNTLEWPHVDIASSFSKVHTLLSISKYSDKFLNDTINEPARVYFFVISPVIVYLSLLNT